MAEYYLFSSFLYPLQQLAKLRELIGGWCIHQHHPRRGQTCQDLIEALIHLAKIKFHSEILTQQLAGGRELILMLFHSVETNSSNGNQLLRRLTVVYVLLEGLFHLAELL